MRRRPLPWDPLRTLSGRLLLAVGLPLALLVIAGATIDYIGARRMTDDAHDRVLASLAIGLSARLETEGDNDLAEHLSTMIRAMGRSQPDDELHYLLLDEHQRVKAGEVAMAALRRTGASPTTRFFNSQLGDKPVRVAQHDYVGPDAHVTILVAETLNARRAEARRLLYVAAVTNVATALAVVVAALVAVRFALRPLNQLGERLEGHEVKALRPLPLRAAPLETLPLLRAINRLMSRVRSAAQARQDFINGTAHQLRTPLSSLSTQVDLLARTSMPDATRARVNEVSESVLRLTHLAHQMLSLARADAESGALATPADVSLPDLLQEVASATLDAALERHMDLGFDPGAATVQGSHWLLRELLMNLVGNAIAHTPEGTAITVRSGVDQGHAFLEVEDNGPGIPPEHRVRVFDRFVRLSDHDRQGSGLGLTIVREIAERHGARVTILDSDSGVGHRIRVDFDPLQPLSGV